MDFGRDAGAGCSTGGFAQICRNEFVQSAMEETTARLDLLDHDGSEEEFGDEVLRWERSGRREG